jgi:hypothetical protein
LPNPGTKLIKRAGNGTPIDREEFDQVVKTSILETIQMIGDDYLDLFLSLLQRKNGIRTLDSASLQEVEVATDSLFARFAIAIKYVIMFRVCASLRLEPPKLLRNLEWTIQELRSSCW